MQPTQSSSANEKYSIVTIAQAINIHDRYNGNNYKAETYKCVNLLILLNVAPAMEVITLERRLLLGNRENFHQ